jgi:hypothetical protein
VKPIAALLGFSLLLTACATQRSTDSIALGEGRTVRYTIPAELAANLNDSALVAKYVDAAMSATAYRHLGPVEGSMKGVRVTGTGTSVDVAYVHSNGPRLHHTIVGTFGITSTRQGDSVLLEVACPTAARVEREDSGLLGGYSPFIEPAKASADLNAICNRAVLAFDRRETGEFDVPFNDASVYANFKRKLTAVDARADLKRGDLSKFLWFNVRDGAQTMTVGVTVYPYRNGSKVTYVWPNRITCRPNARCNLDPTAKSRLNDAITAVAND